MKEVNLPTYPSGLQSQASEGSVEDNHLINVRDDEGAEQFSNKFLHLGLGQSSSTPNIHRGETPPEKPTYVMKFNQYGQRVAVLRPPTPEKHPNLVNHYTKKRRKTKE